MSEQVRAPQPDQVVRVVSVPKQLGLLVCFAGSIEGLLSHWAQGKSWGCCGPDKCPPPLHKSRTVWKGYVPVRVWQKEHATWAPAVLEVTEHLEEMLRGRDLIGECWLLSRESAGKKNGPVGGMLIERRDDPTLRLGFAILAPLQRLFHCLELDLGCPNPLPASLLLPTSSAPGPNLPAEACPREPAPATQEQIETLKQLTGFGKAGAMRNAFKKIEPSANGRDHSHG
jgi:hypothetical protein